MEGTFLHFAPSFITWLLKKTLISIESNMCAYIVHVHRKLRSCCHTGAPNLLLTNKKPGIFLSETNDSVIYLLNNDVLCFVFLLTVCYLKSRTSHIGIQLARHLPTLPYPHNHCSPGAAYTSPLILWTFLVNKQNIFVFLLMLALEFLV